MDVLLVSAEFPPDVGGVGDYTRRLAEALRRRGLAVGVLAPPRSQSVAADLPFPLLAELPPGWGLLRAVERALRRTGARWLHIQHQTGAFGGHPAVFLLPRWLRRRLRVRIAVTLHDLFVPYLFPRADPVRRLLFDLYLGAADRVVTVAPEDRARLRGRLPPDRRLYTPRRPREALWIPIGSNIPVLPLPDGGRTAWRRRRGLPVDAPLACFFGLLGPGKGVEDLIDALRRPEAAPWRLILVGGLPDDADPRAPGYARRIGEALAGLGDRVRILGPLPPEEVSAALQAADAVVLPFKEGASWRRGSLLAALRHGRPVVTTRPGPFAAPELEAAAGEGVLLVPPGDPAALAAALARLAADPTLGERLAAGARRLAAPFDWDGIAQRHREEVYGIHG